ncbi:MAG: radical SAM protein, partial [Chitinispirillia bacterium]
MKVRPSSYIVFVDTIFEDEVFLFQGYTKAVDIVPTHIANLLRNDKKEIDGSVFGGDFEQLYKRGYLMKASWQYERDGVVKLINSSIKKEQNKALPDLMIMPTYACNLACPYCFEKEARNSKQKHNTISAEMVDKAFSSYFNYASELGIDIEDYRKYEGLNFSFYGGEPFLRANREVVEKMVTRAAKEGMYISAITNGTQLDAYEDLMGPGLISDMQISLDGVKETHDKRRITVDGKGTFEKIMRNIELALNKGVHVDLRMNMDRNNSHESKELSQLFTSLGWKGRENFGFYFSSVDVPSCKDEGIKSFRSFAELSREIY